MPLTNLILPGGIVGPSSFAYPVSASPGGAVLFVNSTNGLDSRSRLTFPATPAQSVASVSAQGPYTDIAKPLASVFGANGALSYVVAGRGDLIVVLPGHVEALPAGTTNVPACVSVIGIGYGSNRPTFQWKANANTLVASNGHGAQFQNCIFDLTQVAAVVLGFQIAHTGFQFVNCLIIQSSATNQAAAAILLNTGADDFVFNNSEIDASGAAGAAFGIKEIAGQNVVRMQISASNIHGDFSTAPLSVLGTTTKVMAIRNNIFRQLNAAKTVWNLPAGNTITGTFADNRLYSTSAAAHTDFIAGGAGTGLAFLQNFGYIGKAGPSSGILIPDAGTIP